MDKKVTLKETAKKLIDSFVQDSTVKTKQMTDVLEATAPKIQYSVFEEYFRPRLEEYIFNGRDVVHENYPDRSIVSEWVTVTGSANSEPKIVVGEGNTQIILGSLPPLLPSNNVIAAGNPQGIQHIYGEYEATKNTDPRAAMKAANALTKLGKITKFGSREEHVNKWKKALSDYDNTKNKVMKKDKKIENKKQQTSKSNNELDGMIL